MQHRAADYPGTYDLADLARIFRRRASTIGKVIHNWEKHRGFPVPLPGRRKLWSQKRVDAWIDTPDAQKPLRADPNTLPADAAPPHGALSPQRERAVALQRVALEARYA